MKRFVVLMVLLAACSDPPLSLTFVVTQGSEDACLTSTSNKASSCADVEMPCRSVVSIRIFSPDDPTSPYISVCKELTGQPNLCAIAGVDLPQPAQPVPEQTLEVDMLVFPYSAVTIDPDTGDLQCPTGVDFDDAGFPVAADEPCTVTSTNDCPPDPALGGRAFYHPGDDDTVVELGCVDIEQVDNPACSGGTMVDITATVNDFDTDVSVQTTLADELAVSVGEPKATTVGTETHYILDPADAFELARTVVGPVPTWGANVAASFTSPCLEVLEDGAQTTTTLTCRQADPMAMSLDLEGWRLSKASLDQILVALGEPEFPDAGLVVGLVLDPLGNPVANQAVSSTSGTITYLSADRTMLVPAATSSAGIFLSSDAPFGTTFSVAAGIQTVNGYGGLVDGKVTVVVLQYENPISN